MSKQGRIQKLLKGGVGDAEIRTFGRKLLRKRTKSNPKMGAAAPTATPPPGYATVSKKVCS